jgi:hypothetical protein
MIEPSSKTDPRDVEVGVGDSWTLTSGVVDVATLGSDVPAAVVLGAKVSVIELPVAKVEEVAFADEFEDVLEAAVVVEVAVDDV